MKYGLASGPSEKDLVNPVGQFIQRGWKPIGGIAIASYRDSSGDWGLRFAQAVVAEDAELTSTTPEWEKEARSQRAIGKTILAIKTVRENTKLGLKEAKDLVESWGPSRLFEP